MATKRPQTPNRGAADIISAAIKKVKRMQGSGMKFHEDISGTDFIMWLKDWDLRATKKARGLGRTKKNP